MLNRELLYLQSIGGLAQLARAFAWHAKGHRFDSGNLHKLARLTPGFFMHTFIVYIIYSRKMDKYYVGYTIDMDKRQNEHNTGISTFTSKASDWELKWTRKFLSREEAMSEEKRIKSKKSRKYIEWLISSVD